MMGINRNINEYHNYITVDPCPRMHAVTNKDGIFFFQQ